MMWLGRHLPGAALVVALGIATGFLLGLGAERVPAVNRGVAGHEAGGEEPAHPSQPSAGEIVPVAPAVVAEMPALDPANLMTVLAPAPAPLPPSPETADGARGGVSAAPGRVLQAAAVPKPPISSAQPAWLRNAVPFELPARGPMIALVFDDLGMDRVHTAQVIRLPGPLTLSFLPYAADLGHQTALAHAAGHELLVHMPMEPLAAGLNAGPGALLTRLPPTRSCGDSIMGWRRFRAMSVLTTTWAAASPPTGRRSPPCWWNSNAAACCFSTR